MDYDFDLEEFEQNMYEMHKMYEEYKKLKEKENDNEHL